MIVVVPTGGGHQFYGPEMAAPETLRAFEKSEIDKWWPIIKAANVKVQ